GERILGIERLQAPARHGERVMAEFDALVLLVPFVEREVDDPAQFEAVLVDEAEFLAGARAGRTRKAGELGRIAGREEAGIARFEAELRADRLGAFLADIPGDGAGAFQLAALLAPEDVAEARLALALRPAVHAVAEGARAAGLR